MGFLSVPFFRIIIIFQKSTKPVGFLLLGLVFFTVSNARATLPFQDFKNELIPSDYLTVNTIIDPEGITFGDQFVLHVKIMVREGWHIYSIDAKENNEETLATKITLHSTSFAPQGSWEESTPIIEWDGALERVIKTHQKTVEFRRQYRMVKSLDFGSHQVKGSVVFRACNNRICNLQKEVFFRIQIEAIEGKL